MPKVALEVNSCGNTELLAYNTIMHVFFYQAWKREGSSHLLKENTKARPRWGTATEGNRHLKRESATVLSQWREKKHVGWGIQGGKRSQCPQGHGLTYLWPNPTVLFVFTLLKLSVVSTPIPEKLFPRYLFRSLPLIWGTTLILLFSSVPTSLGALPWATLFSHFHSSNPPTKHWWNF